ncbi:unnamed protein product, partial [Didymodactylos carnosus]
MHLPKYWNYDILFWWISPILKLGYKRQLEEGNLFELSPDDESQLLLNRIETEWNEKNVQRRKDKKRRIRIWSVILSTFWKEFLLSGLILIPFLLVRIAQPLLLKEIILIISSSNSNQLLSPVRDGYLYAVGLSLAILCQIFLHQQYFFRTTRLGMQLRNALSALIYKRMLKLKQNSLQKTTTGEIVNLISNDIGKFEQCCAYFHFLWEVPLEAIVFFILIYLQIGLFPTLFGYAIILFLVLLQILFSKMFAKYCRQTATWTDKRVKLINEILMGCEIIKMYSWEKSLENVVCNELRRRETKSIERANRLRAVNMGLYFSYLSFTALATFGGGLWLMNRPLLPTTLFTTLAFFAILRFPLTSFFPTTIEKFSQTLIATRRIDTFMNLNDDTEEKEKNTKETNAETGTILIEKASFAWDNVSAPQLRDINLNINSGALVGILGTTASGKSSLLSAILDEMIMSKSSDSKKLVSGQFAYVSQSAWIFPGTIRENILFGKVLDELKYRQVILATCLKDDLKQFEPAGDLTVIGDKGVNLSGGQKARVNLARALYCLNDANIFLFDDPLAAVDSKVAEKIFTKCISNNGLLKNKTRLLVTHQIQFLPQTDYCLVLDNGKIKKQCHFNELLETDIDIKQLYEQQHTTEDNKNNRKQRGRAMSITSVTDTDDIRTDRSMTATSVTSAGMFEMSTIEDENSIVKTEQSSASSGRVQGKVWLKLFTLGYGWLGFIVFIFLMIAGEVLFDVTNRWLSLWSAKSFEKQREVYNAAVYLGLSLATLLISLVRSIFFFQLLLNSSTVLHNQMFKGVLYSSLRFYESNPIGRVLNRFSKDQQTVDELLPMTFYESLQSLTMTIGSLVIIGIANPWVLFILLLIIPVILWLRHYSVRTSTEIKRLDSMTRSPIYSLFSSSLSGIPIIRSYKVEYYLIDQFLKNLDRNTRTSVIFLGATRWFGLRIDSMTCLLTLLTAILSVGLRTKLNPASVALALTYCINLTGVFQWAVRQSAETENYMTSTERVYEYSQLPSEPDLLHTTNALSVVGSTTSSWPQRGEIEFQNYKLRYRPELDFVLKGLSVKIDSNERIGICGRTGAGKSSIFQAIFRLTDKTTCTDGQLLIDGIDINTLSLNQLRSALNVIPQVPVLFSNTLRYNLDPFNTYTDEQLWQALEDVQLKETVINLSGKLETQVAEYGQNFSKLSMILIPNMNLAFVLGVGECQLICIARAILKSQSSKILLIDEATANVDIRTDQLIQRIIREKFKNQTVLTIAHRLHTIADNDKILLLDNGKVLNYDAPKNLLFL